MGVSACSVASIALCETQHMIDFQAVPIPQTHEEQSSVSKCVYAWQEQTGCLFAAGGFQASNIHRWDVQQELCTEKVRPCDQNPLPRGRDLGSLSCKFISDTHATICSYSPMSDFGGTSRAKPFLFLRKSFGSLDCKVAAS